MNKTLIKKIAKSLFGTRAAGAYLLLFAIAIGVATFIENDFGTSSAQKLVYRAKWFELLLLLFGMCIGYNIVQYRMIQRKRWSLLTFHLAIIVILLGSAVTRYWGYEGVMHIRENDSSNSILSAETFIEFEVKNSRNSYQFDEAVSFATLGNNQWHQEYLVENDVIDIQVNGFIPNPTRIIKESEDGVPILKLVLGSNNGREEYFIPYGSSRRIRNLTYHFDQDYRSGAVNVALRNGELMIAYDRPLIQMIMATQQVDTLDMATQYYPLRLRSMYTDGTNRFVFGDYKEKGQMEIQSTDPKVRNESLTALKMTVTINGEKHETIVYGQKGIDGRPSVINSKDLALSISYGAKQIGLPFSIKLYDFIMEKYPGTNSASSYASEVQLIDPRNNVQKDFRIYMNHILTYDGFRFFQSSFDQDERGTYLSVNHDFWGTWISYLGYGLLTLGLIMALFSKEGRVAELQQKIKKIRAQAAILTLCCICGSGIITAQKIVLPPSIAQPITKEHSEVFSQLVVQDYRGRMKPVHTLTRELMRKISRKESIHGLNADQIVLGMFSNNKDWYGIPMIKSGKHQKLKELLGIESDFAAYRDFYHTNGQYKLRDEVRRAHGMQPIDRTAYEKELMKVDERVNIASMIFSGAILRVIPVPEDPANTWISTSRSASSGRASQVAEEFFSTYRNRLADAQKSGNYSEATTLLSELSAYQAENGSAVLPGGPKVKGEILLNNLSVFGRLSVVYSLLGLGFLILLFTNVFRPSLKLDKISRILLWLVILAFVFHTFGLGLRWYVSGRAPWSNGYESMIYIAWTSMLAGLIFTRKSLGGLAATLILAATVLLVATLSYLDPEITPLVPVLRSYWLTIHVSLEAGSYGFLMLGALIGLINLILLIFLTERNKNQIVRIIKEMSYISELTLIGGIIMISVGTYLGGVWANESWGRYWGWDAKETWALVTILIYAFILHMRLIPKLQGLYAFNLASLFGWASVIMTYYGVNYYLSGLHSYAAGDPVPIPGWVYIAVVSVILISIAAYWRKRKYQLVIK